MFIYKRRNVTMGANGTMVSVKAQNQDVFDSIQKGSFLDVELKEDSLVFSLNGIEVNTVEAGEAKETFKRRKKLKAVVKEIVENELLTQIIHWADLHRHSGFSLLRATSRIEDMVEKTEYAGALTDYGAMFGIVDYYKKMKKAGKKPILGFEAFTESINGEKNANHLVLLAMNYKGLKNLFKLTSLGFENVYHEKPHLSYEMLRKYSEGVIATSAGLNGEIPRRLLEDDYEGAKRVALELAHIFGKENFYIEIQRHGIEEEDIVNPQLIQLARELDLKIVGTTDSHYTNKKDAKDHEILLCLHDKTTLDDDNRTVFPGEGYHIHTVDEIEELFADIPEALDNTLEIAEKCNVELELGKVNMPHFKVPAPYKDESAYFQYLCWKGFEERFKGTEKFNSEEYRERLQFEMDTINRMGFPGYFLIVWDFVDFAKRRGILVGPGRGSACGSLVAYVLRITEVDPIEYGLLFERFLNVDRISMPDIDIDFEDKRRGEVFDYVKQEYGEESVSKIITFGTMAARMVVRDVARVLGKPYSLGDRIAKAIPQKPKMTLKKAFEESPEFKKMYEEDPEVREVVDIAMKLEGLPRNMSQHACGVIIAPSAVTDFIPQVWIENEETGEKEPTTQFTMSECEEMGLLKMDFLGLRTMGVVSTAIKDINARRKEEGKEPIDFLSIPTDDIKVYDFISKGNTAGVFQLEGNGMTKFMQELFQDAHTYLDIKDKEERRKIGRQLFERVIAGLSLYRPGPIDDIPNYIQNMLNPENITYELPALEPILRNTYGIIVYQEQVMFIVRELAGFSKGQADTIRKAMGKKKKEILDEYEEYFIYGNEDMGIKGCIANGIPEDLARKIWLKLKKFGEYAFNKSHR
jgi:DNA polymerase III subunit alpha